jgi:hypothetical protein
VLLFFLVKSEHNVTGKTILRLFYRDYACVSLPGEEEKRNINPSRRRRGGVNQFCLACNNSVGVKRRLVCF